MLPLGVVPFSDSEVELGLLEVPDVPVPVVLEP